MRGFLLLFLFLCASPALRAIHLIAPPAIEATAPGETVVRWKIDSPAGGRVRYGLSAEKLDQTASDGVGTEHAVTLRGLQPGTRYFFSIGTARTPLTTGSFVAGKAGAAPEERPTVLEKIARAITKPPETSPPPAPKPVVRDAPATRLTWGNMPSLQDHFDRHGGDFGAKSPDDYAAQAWRFRERAVAERLPMKLDTDGTLRVWEGKTGTFAAYNRDGSTKTYFKPGSPDYFARQPGRIVKL
ncbi:MAG: fibronectin type III domain-containing protein, partial [Chthoniobacteraceae bacterium]